MLEIFFHDQKSVFRLDSTQKLVLILRGQRPMLQQFYTLGSCKLYRIGPWSSFEHTLDSVEKYIERKLIKINKVAPQNFNPMLNVPMFAS
jgi:hypothetical protein